MRVHEKQWNASVNKGIYGADFHRFMELEDQSPHMEIAEELGITLGEVKQLKKKVNRT
ncbi:hypothetical protein [Lentibacillus cibarius]|uniref:hypothetical protein n=1 Tax=Lentibacillus cibarius TaxID=2583219 RepID=UPI00148687E1|nr:hypothetical protein [Lentibacillus cibarius]